MRNRQYRKPKPALGFAGKFIRFTKYKVLGQDESGEDILGPGVDVLTDPFGNMILDQGLDYLGSQSWDNLAAVHLGTGNTAPTGSETSISGYVSGSSTDGVGAASGVDSGGAYLYRRISKRFAAGSASGVNLASVAVGHRVEAGEIFSLALIKDTGGSPTTITLAADEVLDVVYELRAYIQLGETTTSATVDGVSTTVTTRLHGSLTDAAWLKFAGALGAGLMTTFSANNRNTAYCVENQPALASIPYWVGYGDETIPTRTYTPGSYAVHLRFDSALGSNNFASGLGAVVLSTADLGYASNNGAWSWGFNPKLNKTAARTAEVTVGVSWGRYTP